MRIGAVDINLWNIPGVSGAGPAAVDTERMIEVPLGLWFLAAHPFTVEIGAVTPYYLTALNKPVEHKVIDPHDRWLTCVRKKAEEVDYSGLDVLSISTIEHVGHGEYETINDDNIAVNLLKNIIKNAKNYLITWAADWHLGLITLAESGEIPVIKLHRNAYSGWIIKDSLKDSHYGKEAGGKGPYPFGNGVYVVTNCKKLLNT